MRKGDFTHRLPLDQTGVIAELARISQSVGKEGKIAQSATMGDASGSWSKLKQLCRYEPMCRHNRVLGRDIAFFLLII